MMNRNLMLMMAMAVLLPLAGLANMDPAERFTWSSQTGWQNWGATHGGVTVVVDGANGYLTGYVWSPTIGWIKLGSGTGPYANTDETNWGVNLDASGNLSGYAWSSQTGWINFNPTHGQVTIDTITGRFEGHAWSPNIGWIGFQNESPAYSVRTTAYDGVGGSYVDWPLLDTLPADRRDPTDRNGPLDLPNLLSYAMGLDPMTATRDDMPMIRQELEHGDRIIYRYRRNPDATDVTMTVRVTGDLVVWSDADVHSSEVVFDSGDGWEIVEESILTHGAEIMILKLRVTSP